MFLAKRGHDFLVFSSCDCLVDPFFPGEPFLLVVVFQSLGDFRVLYVDRIFRLYPMGPRCHHPCSGQGAFQFDPIDPDGGRRAVTVLAFVGVKLSAEGLLLALGSAFLDAEFAWGLRANHECRLDDFRVMFCTCDLKAGKRLARETSRHLVDPLRVTNLNEMT